MQHRLTLFGEKRIQGVDPAGTTRPDNLGRLLGDMVTGSPIFDGEGMLFGIAAAGPLDSWAGCLRERIFGEGSYVLITDRRLAFVATTDLCKAARLIAEVPLEAVAGALRRGKFPMRGSVEIWFTDESMIAVAFGVLFTRSARRAVDLLNG
jgi:hypothetical protein